MNTQSEEINEIAAAMVNVQGAIGPAFKGNKNPFFKSSYANLGDVWEACRDALHANGIAVIQGARVVDGKACMETKLVHISGQWLSSLWEMMPAKEDPQSMGSAITYMRRYSLSAMVGILSADDDGNAASRPGLTPASDQRMANNIDAYTKKAANTVAELPRNEQEWKSWGVRFKKDVDAQITLQGITNCEEVSTEHLSALRIASPDYYDHIADHVEGRREILKTPTQDTPNTPLGAG